MRKNRRFSTAEGTDCNTGTFKTRGGGGQCTNAGGNVVEGDSEVSSQSSVIVSGL